jgi:UV DNA damage repair endonuclease
MIDADTPPWTRVETIHSREHGSFIGHADEAGKAQVRFDVHPDLITVIASELLRIVG